MFCADGNSYFVFTEERVHEFFSLLAKELHTTGNPLKALLTTFPDDCVRLEKAFKEDGKYWDTSIVVIGMLLGAYPENFKLYQNKKRAEFVMRCISKMISEDLPGNLAYKETERFLEFFK